MIDTKNHALLIVEDDPYMSIMMPARFHALGFEGRIITVGTVKESVKTLTDPRFCFDLIMMDNSIVGGNSIDDGLIHMALLNHPTSFIVATSDNEKDIVQQMIAGCHMMLPKTKMFDAALEQILDKLQPLEEVA